MSKESHVSPEDLKEDQLIKVVRLGFTPSIVASSQIPEVLRGPISDLLKRRAERGQTGATSAVSAGPEEVRKLIESLKLENEYAEAVETQKVFELLQPGEKVPDYGQVLTAFTPEMLVAAQNFKRPSLILNTKGRSFYDLVEAMDLHRIMTRQEDVYVHDMLFEHADQRPERWSAYIMEGALEVDVRDFDIFSSLTNRMALFDAYKKINGIHGMDRWKYAQHTLGALKNGFPGDDYFYSTILDEDPATSDSHILYAGWRLNPGERLPEDHSLEHKLVFGPADEPESHRGPGLWFRPSVGGDIPNA